MCIVHENTVGARLMEAQTGKEGIAEYLLKQLKGRKCNPISRAVRRNKSPQTRLQDTISPGTQSAHPCTLLHTV